MNILSLFDGMSCAQIAINKLGVANYTYYASEIDKHAIKVTQANYPNTIQLGDINNWREWSLPPIDLLIGGSPCQGFSSSGKCLNFEDPRSRLFFTFVEILKAINPKYFVLENVKMKKEWMNIITEYIGVQPVEINSALVSAQNRKRLYWTNIPNITQPEDRGIRLIDIIEDNTFTSPASIVGYRIGERGVREDNNYSIPLKQYLIVREDNSKIGTLTTVQKDTLLSNIKPGRYLATNYTMGKDYRKLTPLECERLQTVPDNYTNHVSNNQRYIMLGNGFTVDVITHILSYMENINV